MRTIAIIGAGPAGIEAASVLAAMEETEVLLFEKSATTMDNLRDKAFLFPDFSSAADLVEIMEAKLNRDNIKLHLSTAITSVASTSTATEAGGIMAWELQDALGVRYQADAVLVTTGYRVFDAHRKEELGYGIYPGVITSIDLEKKLQEGKILNAVGDIPKKIVFLQCVGSRDEKSGNHYCSKVCCVTAVKQAIEVRKLLPEVETYIFYMDLRMWGGGFEEMYRDNIKLHLSTAITSVASTNTPTEAGGIMAWELQDVSGARYQVDAVLVTTGYRVFDAHRKEELGYGIYPGVITSIDLEKKLKEGKILNAVGDIPKKIVFLQCVGSRDEKSGNHYCSKVCCVTAVKQAIEVRKLLPEVETYIFYMDLRMWGGGFEEMYRESQEKYGVRYVRGRISEAASTYDGKIQIKSEDTLVGLPLKMSADLLVLMVGMEPSEGTKTLTRQCNCADAYGFATTVNPHARDNETAQPGLYVAGSCKRPMSINDSLTDARSAALRIAEYLK